MALAITIVIALVVILALFFHLYMFICNAERRCINCDMEGRDLRTQQACWEDQKVKDCDIVIAWLQKQQNVPWPDHTQGSLNSLLFEALQDRAVAKGDPLDLHGVE